MLCCVPGVWGVWGRDEFGVTGFLGVNGFAAGLRVNFFGAFCCFSEVVSFAFPGVTCKNFRRIFIITRKTESENTIFTKLVDAADVLFGVLLLLLDIWGCEDCMTGDWYSWCDSTLPEGEHSLSSKRNDKRF